MPVRIDDRPEPSRSSFTTSRVSFVSRLICACLRFMRRTKPDFVAKSKPKCRPGPIHREPGRPHLPVLYELASNEGGVLLLPGGPLYHKDSGWMKSSKLNVILLVVNLGLLASLIYFIKTRPAPLAPEVPVTETLVEPTVVEHTNILTVTNEWTWQQLESEDYRAYIARLRSIGCPEQTIR